MTSATTSTKREQINDVKKIAERMRSGGVEVGILDGTGTHPKSKDAITIEVGVWQELGTKNIPSRPFLRSTIDDKQNDYMKTVRRLTKLIQDGKITLEVAEGIIGSEVQGDIQQKIVDIDTPPNSPATIKKKKSSNPLIDEGHLRQSIKWSGYDG